MLLSVAADYCHIKNELAISVATYLMPYVSTHYNSSK